MLRVRLVTLMNYAIINAEGLVVNTIHWNGVAPWNPPVGHTVLPLLEGGIGWTCIDGQFLPPPELT